MTEASPELRFGDYRTQEELGRGGLGIVYRALHEGTGRVVALKVLHDLTPAQLATFRREAHFLAGIDHPDVARMLEHCDDAAEPWCAMEFVEGECLDSLWRANGSGERPPLEPALRALHAFCGVLSFLHGTGVVHRDLKPDNVLVRPDGRPVLVDFGLASRFGGVAGREALEAGGDIVGSVAYMAPEQALGDYVDARADLYALGCMLYEAVVGEPPFTGRPWDVIERHLDEAPRPPSERGIRVDRDLEGLILRLLEKEPRNRLGFATDVAAVLGRQLEPEPRRVPEGRAYLYRPSFVGRSAPLDAILGRLEAAREGDGALLLVSGESGVGKTRLAMQSTRRAAESGYAVVTGECLAVERASGRAGGRGAPLHPLRPLLRAIVDHCVSAGPEATRRILGERAGVLSAYEPDLAGLPGVEGAEAVELPAADARARTLSDLAATLRAFAAEQPLLLVIDDLQWADELTLELLQGLPADFFASAPLMVLGTYRSEEATAFLREVSELDHVVSLELGRMSQDSVSHIVGEMLALQVPPPQLVHFVAEASEGNPFFVCEFLRTTLESGLLRRDAGQWSLDSGRLEGSEGASYDALPLPRSIGALVEQRLTHVGAAAASLLQAASVVGRSFDLDLAGGLARLDAAERMEAVSELIHRQLVDEAEGSDLRFTHDKVREVAYGRVEPHRLQVLHERAAREIETRYAGEGAERWFAILGHHWSMAGDIEKARHYLDAGAEHALRGGADRQAERLLLRALQMEEAAPTPSPAAVRVRRLRMLGTAEASVGDLDASTRHSLRALEEAGMHVPESAAGWVGVILAELGRRAWARPPAADDGGDEPVVEAARAAEQAATAFYYEADLVRAMASNLRCVNLAEASGKPEVAPLAYAQLAYVLGAARLGYLSERYFRRARARGSEGDPTALAAGIYFHAMREMGFGHWERSLELGIESLAIMDRIDNRQEGEIAGTVVANTLHFAGRFQEAFDRSRVVLDSAEQRWNAQHIGWGLFQCGRERLCLGKPEEALDLIQRGYECLSRVPDRVSLIMCEGQLGRALIACGREDRALEVADRLAARAADGGLVPLAQCLQGYAGLAEVYLHLVEHSGSAELAERAVAACRELRRFAWMFPMARPASLRNRGVLEWTRGRRGPARRLFARAAREAKRLRMPYEEALAHRELARRGASGAREHALRARELLADLGCAVEEAEPERGVAS